jgi:hypothetical protein
MLKYCVPSHAKGKLDECVYVCPTPLCAHTPWANYYYCSAGRGPDGIISPSSAKQELEVLADFEHGSALALTLTLAGNDPRTQQVRSQWWWFCCLESRSHTLIIVSFG